jgi:hypothetical protein
MYNLTLGKMSPVKNTTLLASFTGILLLSISPAEVRA